MGISGQKQSRWTKYQELAFQKTFGVSDKVVAKWKAEGFSFVSASGWAEWKVSASRASQFRAEGHTKAPSRRFHERHISLLKALEWTRSGFRPETAMRWIELGVSADDACDLRDHEWDLSVITRDRKFGSGLEDQKAIVNRAIEFVWARFHYNSVGIRPAARPWFELGVTGWEAVALLSAGWTVPEIYRFIDKAVSQGDLGITPNEIVERAIEFAKANFDVYDSRDWILCGADVKLAKEFLAVGIDPIVDGQDWVRLGISARHAADLLASGWSTWEIEGLVDEDLKVESIVERALEFAKAGFEKVDSHDWILCGADVKLAKELQAEGFGIDQAVDWIRLGITAESARKALAAGWSVEEVQEALRMGVEFEELLKWTAAGFESNTALHWINELTSLDDALKYSAAGIDYPVQDHFYDPDISIDDAIEWFKHGFTEDTAKEFIECGLTFEIATSWMKAGFETESELNDSHDPSDQGWKFWHEAGFTPTSARAFRTKLIEFARTYARLPHDTSKNPSRDDEWLLEAGPYGPEATLITILLEAVRHLTKVGIEVTIESVYKWRNIEEPWILAAIDNGIDPDDVYEMGSASLTADSRELFEVIDDLGITFLPALPATWFIEHGFSTSEVNQLIKQEIDLSDFIVVANRSDVDPKTMLKWAVAGWKVTTTCRLDGLDQSVIVPWLRSGFTAKAAIKWNSEMISAELAKEWRDSGVDDPVVAKRRIRAGLRPRIP